MDAARSLKLATILSLAIHTLILAVPMWVLVDEWLTPSIDANIGYGLSLFFLVPLGVPWSLAVWIPFHLDPSSTGAWVAPVTVAAALANLALHAWLWRRKHRRRRLLTARAC